MTSTSAPAIPAKLEKAVNLLRSFDHDLQRESLISLSRNCKKHEPQKDETFDIQDDRHDPQCHDRVGIYLKTSESGIILRAKLGENTSVLTKAMSSLLCDKLSGCQPEEILEIPDDYLKNIFNQPISQKRIDNLNYLLTRIKEACQKLRNKPEEQSQ